MWAFAKAVISKRVTVGMFVLGLVVLGLVGFDRMPWEQNPNVDFPFVTVIVTYPGAGPEEIEQEILRPLEDEVSVLSDVRRVESVAQENVGTVGIEFNYEAEIDAAAADVRDAVARVKARFPEDAEEPSVLKIDLGALPIMSMAVTGNRSPRDLRRLVEDVIKPRLGQVGGVASVTVTGGEVREIQVVADKRRLEAVGLSISRLSQFISLENLDVPAGTIEEGRREYRVRVIGRARDLQVLRDLRIDTPRGGLVRLGDIAEVIDTVVEPDEYARLNGESVVGVRIIKQSGANTVEVADGVRRGLDELKERLPADVEITISRDDSEDVKTQVIDVLTAIRDGTLLAALVVFLFLHNARGMLIAALAIPTSMITAFLVIGLGLHFTLNSMVLLALAISVGILVDNSVVILENVQRHLNRGELPDAAATNGWSEIGWAVITTSVVDVSIFFPVAIMGGLVGRFMYPFALTIVCVSVAALVIAAVLTPMLAAWWFERKRSEDEQVTSHPKGGVAAAGAAWKSFWESFYAVLDRIYASVESVYRIMLGWVVAHPYLTVLIGYGLLVAIAMGVTRFNLLGAEFAPQVDRGSVSITVEMPAGTRLDVTDRLVRQVEERVMDAQQYPEIDYVFSQVGSTGSGFFGSGQSGPNWGSLDITLSSARDRRTAGQRSDQELAEALRQDLADLPAQLTVSAQAGMGAGGAPIELELIGEDYDELTRVATDLKREVANIEGLIDVDTSAQPGSPEIQIDIDRLRAADLELSVGAVAQAVRTAIAGSTGTRYREGGDEYDIRVQLAEADRASIEDIGELFIGLDRSDNPILLRDVADLSIGTGPTRIERRDRRRSITVSAFNPGIVQAAAEQRIMDVVEQMDLRTVDTQWAGQTRFRGESFSELGKALALSIALIYIVTAALYNSVLQPLSVLFTVPLALIGAIIGLVVTGNTLNIVSIIGIIMLVGLVARNAIILLDYTDTLRARGMTRTEALMVAGPHRMKPIFMTVGSTVLGVLPTALALAEGAEMRAPMAWVLIFGLIFGTSLSLLVVPASYCIWDRVGSVVGNCFAALFTPGVSCMDEIRGIFRRLWRRATGQAEWWRNNHGGDGEESDE